MSADPSHTLLNNDQEYQRMSRAQSPFGDGHASKRIVEAMEDFYGMGQLAAVGL